MRVRAVTLDTVEVKVGRETKTPIRVTAARAATGTAPLLKVVSEKAG